MGTKEEEKWEKENLFGNIVTYNPHRFTHKMMSSGEKSEFNFFLTQRHDNLHKTWLKKDRPYQIIYHSNFKQRRFAKKAAFLCMYSFP